jgi:hypothetical protein
MFEVFRFMTFQPPQPARTPPVDTADAESEFQKGLNSDLARDRPLAAVKGRAQQYVRSQLYVSKLSDIATPLKAFADDLDARQSENLESVTGAIQQVFQADAATIVGSEQYRRDRRNVGDSLIALTILGADNTSHYQDLVKALRLCGLLERVAQTDPILRPPRAIERALRATIVLPGRIFPLPPVVKPEVARRARQEIEEQKKVQREEQRQRYQTRILSLRLTKEELEELPSSSLKEPAFSLEERRSVETPQPQEAELRIQPIPLPSVKSRILSEGAIAQLSDVTKDTLASLNLSPEVTPLPRMLRDVESALRQAYQELMKFERETRSRRRRSGSAGDLTRQIPGQRRYW